MYSRLFFLPEAARSGTNPDSYRFDLENGEVPFSPLRSFSIFQAHEKTHQENIDSSDIIFVVRCGSSSKEVLL